MSSIATAVFKATIGLLINKARDTAAQKLKEGDVTDEKFRSLIVREIDKINSKLDGLARKDLLSSMSAFKEGIAILFDVFNKANRGSKDLTWENCNATGQAAAEDTSEVSLRGSAHARTVSLAKKLGELQLIDLDESSKELLSDAKERFKEARSKARDAFSNEGLDTSDRILAAMVRVMSTILEKVDNPVNALTPCRVCLEELHALPAVKKSFKVALAKGLKSLFGKDERKEIIAAVCDINHAIFDVTHMLGSNGLIWPLIDVGILGKKNVHPLLDREVAEINEQNIQYIRSYYPMHRTFGEDVLKSASCICINSKDQFIVGDDKDCNIKVFDSDGRFLYSLSYAFENRAGVIVDVATDQADNVYALVGSVEKDKFEVGIFDKDSNKHCCFAVDGLRASGASRLTVVEEKSRQVFVVGAPPQEQETSDFNFVVNVYGNDGRFLRSFVGVQSGQRAGCQVEGITVCNDGRVMVLYGSCVHVFSAEGDCLHQFSVGQYRTLYPLGVAEARANEQVIVVSQMEYLRSHIVDIVVAMYTQDGESVCRFEISMNDIDIFYRLGEILGIAMNRQGRIALALKGTFDKKYKILALYF